METRINKDGSKRFRETVTYGSRRVKSPFFARKSDAKTWKAQELTKRDNARIYGVELSEVKKVKLEDYCIDWLEGRIKNQRSQSTYYEYSRMIQKKLLPILENKYLQNINKEDGHRFIRELQKRGHNPRGVNKILSLFKQIMKEAEKDNLIIKSPLINVQNLKEIARTPTYWTKEDINRFLLAVRDHYSYEFYFTALNTGMRRGELCGLKWDKIDFVRSMIEVSRIRDRYGLRETTKSGKTRFVPMNTQLRDTLLQLSHRRINDYVFIKECGQPMAAQHAYREFNKLQKESGVSTKIRVHDLRHTFASHFMMNGGNPYDLQKILGHHDFKMTQIYAHLSPEHLARTTEILNFQVTPKELCPRLTPDEVLLFDQKLSETKQKEVKLGI